MSTVISSIARTPIGRFGGAFRATPAIDLGAAAMSAAIERSGLEPALIDEVWFGHVVQAGTGQITSRQAAVKAGVPMTVPSTTINKVCLSGMSAIGVADRAIRLGEAKFVLAGGMESMSQAPYLVPGARWGLKYGNGALVDALETDGLFCALDKCTMGASTDARNRELGMTRPTQDAWALQSHQRAAKATAEGWFSDEIVPVAVETRAGVEMIGIDEGFRTDTSYDALASLRPAFTKDGDLTAGNASQMSDGAAALIVADSVAAEAEGLPVLAEVIAYGQIGGADATLLERPAEAIRRALKSTEFDVSDLDLVEINEAFASVAVWSSDNLGLDHSRVNVHGGAIALGHPLGATGARIVVTLINALRSRGGGLGAAALCGGGGQGDALIVRVP
ncbi:MAG: acetyl-CoA C-acyltransferase [Acidimicrobiia bacterium]|nr:acetyl-CoA C-acyltransferase [Acidimicrobiia bacterium]NND13185.1 acetyl-CoA C-acyltransferase [Acidimicrobiia bacterium]NNL48032.1 acetyl-CoA C-acyltransferase [Acidimicrobiia bacterium]